jgi:hypothetical protein
MGSRYKKENRRLHAYIYYPHSRLSTGLPRNETFPRRWDTTIKATGSGFGTDTWSPYSGSSSNCYRPRS